MERAPTGELGDRSADWRRSYLHGAKDPLVGERRTNRRRLAALGASEIDPRARWLDLGAGDGNVAMDLARDTERHVVALEYQEELLGLCPPAVDRVVGSAVALPTRDGAFDVVLAMDVLHHVAAEHLGDVLGEVRRCLRPGGLLLVCEPAPTIVRRVLEVALMSRLSQLTQFSRDKRTMVELEADTLVPWLEAEPVFVDVAAAAGFVLQRSVRRPLHTLRRLARP